MRAFSLTITPVPLYYFHTNKSGCHVMGETREGVEVAGGISGFKNFSKRIKVFKVSRKRSYFFKSYFNEKRTQLC